MKFHREGINIILITISIIVVLLILLFIFFPSVGLYHYLIFVFFAVMLVLVLRFFRIPTKRGLIDEDDLVLSGADGVVVTIEETEEPEYFKDRRLQVSVFMSIHNVHINWLPISGTIAYYKYHPGLYLIAKHPKSSVENERTSLVVEDNKGRKVLMRQIAGMVARRIVCYAKEGNIAIQGKEIGFIKFGSRVDLFLPLDAEILVKPGQKVKGRMTAIAKLAHSS